MSVIRLLSPALTITMAQQMKKTGYDSTDDILSRIISYVLQTGLLSLATVIAILTFFFTHVSLDVKVISCMSHKSNMHPSDTFASVRSYLAICRERFNECITLRLSVALHVLRYCVRSLLRYTCSFTYCYISQTKSIASASSHL